MSSEKVNRHLTRKQKLNNYHQQKMQVDPLNVSREIDVIEVIVGIPHKKNHVLVKFDKHQQYEMNRFSAPITVSAEEVEMLLTDIRSRWDTNQLNLLIQDCRNSVLRSIVGPFGLGNVVSTMDKNGGNVTTIHNAKKDIYARTEDEYRRNDYIGSSYIKNSNRYKDSKIIENTTFIEDEYSGHLYDYSEVDCDHVIPIKQYHQEGGYMQSNESKQDFASDPENFAMTNSSANRSLGSQDKKDWQEKQASDGSGLTNKQKHKHDNRRINPKLENAEQATKAHLPSNLQKVVFYGREGVKTGCMEAGKMGLQQAFGLLLTEFFSATFDEIADSYKNGFRNSLKNQSFFEALQIRLTRIGKRVIKRWKEALRAFKEGAISGFISNLITMLINMLVTTGKRIVRVIREGFMSITRAVQIALFPPEGMTTEEACDTALKLLSTGVVISIGILGEEVVEKSVSTFFSTNMPPLAPYAGIVSSVIVGAVTGIVSAVLVYGLDNLDVFGVNNQRKHIFVMQELDNLIAETD